jgi:hypothetical protein
MKALKVLFATLAIATVIVGAFAFTTSSNKKFDMKVFQYTGTRPATASLVVDPNNWTLVGSPSYVAPAEVIAAIEFDDATYPLVSDKPDFAGQSTLSSTVSGNYNDATKHLQTINSIKFYFTEQP